LRLTIPYKYNPRGYQRNIYNCLAAGYKRGMAVWHRRAGKDKTFFNLMTKEAFKRVGLYFYILPYYKQARMVVWNGMDKTGFKLLDHVPQQLIAHRDNQQMILTLVNGSLIQLVGSDDVDSIVGTNPIGMLFSEFSLQKPKAWELMAPILLENGGWALFNCTPRGMNHAYDMFMAAQRDPQHWFSEVLTVNDTYDENGRRIVTEEMIQSERDRGVPEELIQQEYFCSWNASLAHAYYADQMAQLESDGRICSAPYNPNFPVVTGWDLGFDDSNVIWFAQVLGRDLVCIDVLANHGKGLPWYIQKITDKPYKYSQHYLPHDIAVHDFSIGIPRYQVMEELGIPAHKIQIMEKQRTTGEYLPEAISFVRQILPKCVFDNAKCLEGVNALRAYRRAYDEDKGVFGDRPIKDWTKHYADAFRTLCQGVVLDSENTNPLAPPYAMQKYSELDDPYVDGAYSELYDYEEERYGLHV
jgi:phage terminase large subunit